MTIQGAINELVNLLNADDVPFYYKGGIQKVIETIQMELIAEQTEPNSSEKPTCEDCKHNGEKHAYDYACDKCTDMDKFQHEDEPQTDCAWRYGDADTEASNH